MTSYDAFLKGQLRDYEYPQEEIEAALELCPIVE
jgi:hypothetical protein